MQQAKAGDHLYVHYSGHGGSVTDTSGDEKDGKDETLVPLDYRKMGQLTDDTIIKELVLAVPEGVMLTVVIDACHSGTVLDLPYTFVADDDAMQATGDAIANGEDVTMQQNPEFDLSYLVDLGKKLLAMHDAGASLDELAQEGLRELAKTGVFGDASRDLAGGKITLDSVLNLFKVECSRDEMRSSDHAGGES